ncbi:tripartite tricarboxylate transporter substrate binding protein [Noviherbaspirillum sp. L7-7A]|uniref:Bug family tripartite tricarboxylate transporter substrate binding protein n=1 Tax=Noviherbaspirillum sp. L7-7A TaxID=2850560 RepID=UPI00201392C4|nr:tripartite tricarboxylate transporter substrate binding protein [Noviherbaspirillum sp. L7-7A]
MTLSTGASFAQNGNWPNQPIRFIVPYTPGGGTDTVTRHIAEKMSGNTKWTFLVDNKPGANGNIGMDAVAKSKPDGYTIGMGQTANLAINSTLIPKMPFNASKDLVPVALVAELPTVMVVRADSPWKSVGDAVKAAKAKPGEVKQALAGNGTVGHLAGEMLSRQAGIQVLNIPYKGAAPAITDLIGGQTDYMFATPQSVAGMIKGGKLRAIAVTSQKRLSFLPNVPTVAESGYKDFVAMDWKAIVAPAGTPPEIVQRLNAEVGKALAQPALVATLEAEGSTPMTGSPEQAAKFIKAEQEKWGSLIREAGIKPD